MNILLAEDDEVSRQSICEFLCELGHQVIPCENGLQAWEAYREQLFNLVLTDIKMPQMNGINLLQKIKAASNDHEVDVILFTGHGDLNSAITALRLGASDYLLKPIKVLELADIIQRVVEKQASKQSLKFTTEQFVTEEATITKKHSLNQKEHHKIFTKIIGIGDVGIFSEAMRKIFFETLKLHQDRDIPVLIEGETGTGKEVIARLIHYGDSDNETPFIDINCAALTPSLFESELFGYEAGAYTGAQNKGSIGKIDMAFGGTLFLDEIGEMSVEQQAKLLRVLQEKEFYRVGGLKKIKTNIRLLCATNANLKERVEQGTFRSDLFFRLNVFNLRLPPLRERPYDIVVLAQIFLKEFSLKKGKKFREISAEAEKVLINYNWPGNIRELRNVMEWVIFNYDDALLQPEHLGLISRNRAEATQNNQEINMNIKGQLRLPLYSEGLLLEEHIDNIVTEALSLHNGNKAKTARYLNISRRALYNRLERMEKKTKIFVDFEGRVEI